MTDIGVDAPIGETEHPQMRVGWFPVIALFGLVIAGDQLPWAILPGISLPLFLVAVATVTHVIYHNFSTLRSAVTAWGILCIALLPTIDVVQPLSIAFALAGMLGFVGVLVGERGRKAAFAALRFPFNGAVHLGTDSIRMVQQPRSAYGGKIGSSLRDWIVPAGLGLLFAALLLIANPVLEQWVTQLFTFDRSPMPSETRLIFWVGIAILIWPFLRLSALRNALIRPTPKGRAFGQVWYLSPRSVWRALVLFNVLFAAQTVTDLAILWGGAALPDGMTYANYAHRGAYPLLFAALLAGGFALLSQPFLTGRPALRILLLIWVGQTALLVGSSMLRLDLYIDAYSLTRLRFAAFVWMGVIGGGLILMLWQIIRGFGPGWLIMRATELGVITLYTCSLINVDGLVARHNLASGPTTDFGREMDAYYVCGLGEGAAVAIARYEAKKSWPLCVGSYGKPNLTSPTDWREWGYRNARLRTNLAKIEGNTR